MELQTVPLGETGLRVSELALGTARFGAKREDGSEEIDRETAYELLNRYAEVGGNFIDMADAYADGTAETYVGDWLEDRERENFVLTSKIYWPSRDDPNASGLNRKHLRHQLDTILDRLGTEYLDVLYIHRWDDETPPAEFMRTLDEFVSDGRVHYLGASNREPNAWQVVKANELARRRGYEPFTCAQIIYNLVDRQIEPEYLPMVQDYGLGLTTFSPLARGFLTGKYERGEDPPSGSRGAREDRFWDEYLTEENFDLLEELERAADSLGASTVQAAIAWLLTHPDVTSPVIGPRTPEQLEENLMAAEVNMSSETFERLANLAR